MLPCLSGPSLILVDLEDWSAPNFPSDGDDTGQKLAYLSSLQSDDISLQRGGRTKSPVARVWLGTAYVEAG